MGQRGLAVHEMKFRPGEFRILRETAIFRLVTSPTRSEATKPTFTAPPLFKLEYSRSVFIPGQHRTPWRETRIDCS